MKRNGFVSIFLILVIIFALFAGCESEEVKSDGTQSKEHTSSVLISSDTNTDQSASDTTSKETDTLSDEAYASLVSLRQGMVGTSELFSVAYMGCTPDMDEVNVNEWLKSTCPTLCNDLPFITEIPNERIIGTKFGELYCIVPLDEDATVAVNGAISQENDEYLYDNVLYKSEKGDPILLFCNNSGFVPDVQIVITNTSGNSVTWYPKIADTGKIERVNGTCNESLMGDFTSYFEHLRMEYATMKEAFWVMPTEEQLIGTNWSTEEYLDNGNINWYEISFNDKTVDIRWNNDGEDHEYSSAKWSLSYDEGVALIKFDFGGFAGEQTCAVLITTREHMLYTCANIVAGEDILCNSGFSSRILEKSVG